MSLDHIFKIAEELGVKSFQVEAASRLLDDGATIPFIARYRKEATGLLDEVQITKIRDRLNQLRELNKRRESILKSLEERELLTDELRERISAAETMSTLEDIYLPYKPKRRTRATIAMEKGLEPLAALIFKQDNAIDPLEASADYVNIEKGVETTDDALNGARDIIAEWINENQEARDKMRRLFATKGVFHVNVIPGKEREGAKYRDYFDWQEPVATAPSHRILAMRRGESEEYLDLKIRPPEDEALTLLESLFVKGDGLASIEVRAAVHDCYKRLLSFSMETEMRLETKKRADETAIKIFSDNLRELLLASPLGQKRVLGIDPGIRTGCKVVCLDQQGKLIHHVTIFPLRSENEKQAAAETIIQLCNDHGIEAIAIGNGTGGRETEGFVKNLPLHESIIVAMVNESGASVYSASETARNEFPDLDVSYRGAVSIGRRLMDPLAELVKIDPKAIGVGQYQHDVNQNALKTGLDDVVISCVNAVGVEVNTASEQLLTYVSGLGPQLAKNIIAYRNEFGPLVSRERLKDVPRLGPKAFEQAAGFLRIHNGINPLDASAVHPESYGIVENMAADLGCSIPGLLTNATIRERIDLSRYVTEKIGMPTLTDIMKELAKPGRDPRKEFEYLEFKEGVESINDLKTGMKLNGVVTNVTAFGAFVDVGVHQDGLVHISQLADHYVKDPNQVVRVNQRVTVTVLDVDLERKRISLSLKEAAQVGGERVERPSIGDKKMGGNKGAGRSKREPFNNPFVKIFR
ncbi:MAG: RNA-binding transcriptional accessory protein [Deltaproteobacteria bacterium]|nr:RNA-binding transcriptional accessory protein [Deltaproteobacteria bacterium]